MSYELQYTSAERTLQAGVKGFGPVVSTRGMPATLQDRLIALSGYRHLFAVHDAQAARNPVNHSHLIVSTGQKTFHVLSRIADAGFDYSHRSNKFAHHVAVEDGECVSGGPARVLADGEFMAKDFAGQPRWLEQGRPLPAANGQRPAECRAWQLATGDAGWGGMLAQSATDRALRPVVVVYPLKVDPLALVIEALNLLPDARRWQVTFSTFFTKLPPGIDCLWRFVPSEDPEAKATCRQPNVRVIDLTQRLPALQENLWVIAARTGMLPQPATRGTKQVRVGNQVGARSTRGVASSGAVDALSLGLDALDRDDLFNFELMPVSQAALDEASGSHRRDRRMVALVAGAAVTLSAVIATGSLLWPSTDEQSSQVAVVEPVPIAHEVALEKSATAKPLTEDKVWTRRMQQAEPITPSAVVPTIVNRDAEREPPKLPTAAKIETKIESPPPVESPVPTPVEAKKVDVVAVKAPPKVEHPLHFARGLRAKSDGLPLPAAPLRKSLVDEGASSAAEWTSLVKLPNVKAEQVELTLDSSATAPAKFALVNESRDGSNGWTVIRKTGNPAGDDELGRLRIGDEQLLFRWFRVHRGMHSELLSKARLTLRIAGEEVTLPLASNFTSSGDGEP